MLQRQIVTQWSRQEDFLALPEERAVLPTLLAIISPKFAPAWDTAVGSLKFSHLHICLEEASY